MLILAKGIYINIYALSGSPTPSRHLYQAVDLLHERLGLFVRRWSRVIFEPVDHRKTDRQHWYGSYKIKQNSDYYTKQFPKEISLHQLLLCGTRPFP